MTEQELMAFIRANLARLPTDITSGENGYTSAELERLLPGAAIYASQDPGAAFGYNEGAPGVGRGGLNFRLGEVSAMYNPDGTLADVIKHKPDSLGFQLARIAMPALAAGAGLSAAGAFGGAAGSSAAPISASSPSWVAPTGAAAETAAMEGWLGAGAAGAGAGAGAASAPIVASAPSFVAPAAGGAMDWGSLLSNPSTWLSGAQVVGGVLGANAADDAADAQVAASNAAIAEQRRQYDQTRADFEPWRTTGVTSLNALSGLLGLNGGSGALLKPFTGAELASEPGYQFGLQQGEQAINRAASGRGSFDSGATLKNLMRFNTDYAGTKFNEAFNRDQVNKSNQFNWLSGLSGTGQAATNQVASAGANMSNNVGDLMTGIGNARASGYVGQTNAVNNTLGNITNNWMQQNMLSQLLARR